MVLKCRSYWFLCTFMKGWRTSKCAVGQDYDTSQRGTHAQQCWSYVMHQISHRHQQRAALQNGNNREKWQTCPVVFVHSPGWASKLPIAHLSFHVNSPVTAKQIFLWVFESCRHDERARVRNMVSQNFLPFQLQTGNLVLKLDDYAMQDSVEKGS